MMKQLITILTGLLITATAFCQFPNTQFLANNATLLVTRGGQRVDSGLVIGNFADTASVNKGPWIKTVPYIRITVGGVSTYMRNATANAWLLMDGPGAVSANMGLSLNTAGNTVQFGQSVGSVTNPSIITENREIPTGAFPNRNSVSFTTDYSGIGPFPLAYTKFRYGGVIDLTAPNGPGVDINELDSSNFFGDAFPSLVYTTGYNKLVQVFTGMHWTAGDKHYDIADIRNSMKSAQIQAGGLGLAGFDSSGATFLGWGHSVHRTNLGSCCTIGGQTLNVTGSGSFTDSLILRSLLTGSSADSVLTTSGGLTKRVTQASLGVSLSSLTAALAAGGMDNANFEQDWQWNTLSAIGLNLISASPNAPTGNAQVLLAAQTAGTNSNAGATSRAIFAKNNHTGSTSTNVALWASATNGTNNYAIIVPSSEGSVGIGTITPAKLLQVAGTVRFSALGTPVFDTTTYKPLGISSAGDIISITSWPFLGTVTTVSVVTSQGVSGSVATATTTPAITLSLGALTGVTSFNGLVVTANTGAITTGSWAATTIGATVGGTGQTTVATGDLLQGTASNTWGKLSSVAAGSYLRSAGTTTASVWSTLILPNAATANRIVYATSTNTYGESANFTFDGNNLTVSGATVSGSFQTLSVGANSNFSTAAGGGTFNQSSAPLLLPGGAGTGTRVIHNGTTSSVQTAGNDFGELVVGGGLFTEATSGTAPRGFGLAVLRQTISNGTATVDSLIGFYDAGPPIGVAANIGSWAAVFASGDVLIKNGNLALNTAGNKLTIAEGTDGRVGQTTLSSGTKAITINGLTTNSRALVQLVTPSGATLTVNYQAVCTANTLTIQANLAATTINTADGSTLNYFVLN